MDLLWLAWLLVWVALGANVASVLVLTRWERNLRQRTRDLEESRKAFIEQADRLKKIIAHARVRPRPPEGRPN